MENKDLKKYIKKFMDEKKCEIFGDRFIGYRAYNKDGAYDDEGLEEVYQVFLEHSSCENWNEICESIKSGGCNW